MRHNLAVSVTDGADTLRQPAGPLSVDVVKDYRAFIEARAGEESIGGAIVRVNRLSATASNHHDSRYACRMRTD